jgi:hypothetical protein
MPNVDITPEELAHLVELRKTDPIPGTRGQPMPYDASARAWGEAPPANPAVVTRLPSPQTWVDKQISTLSAVGAANYRIGITQPKKSPTASAIAAQPKYEAAMRDPQVLARRTAGLRNTTDEIWASRAENIGADRLVSGVVQRRDKVERQVTKLHGLMTQHLQRIDGMPNVTASDAEQRMLANLKGMRAMRGL